MIWHTNRMSRRQPRSPLTVLLLILAALVVLVCILFRGALSGALWRIASPVVAWRNSFSAGEVARLRAELASTTAALADRETLAKENAPLRAELGRSGGAREVVAAVLMHPPGTPYDTLVLDAGSSQGIRAGQEVRVGALSVGVIDEVYGDRSRATLYSAPGQSYQATLTTHSASLPVALEGQGGGSMEARVPSATDVHVGDTVEFPGLSGAIAGAVSAVEGRSTDTFKTVYVRLPVNIFQVQYVYIRQ